MPHKSPNIRAIIDLPFKLLLYELEITLVNEATRHRAK